MNRIAMFIAPLVALALTLAYTQVIRAEDAAATGSVSVTVTDKDGKPVEGAAVRVTAHKSGGAKSDAAAKSDEKLADDKAPSSGTKATPVAESKTDKDGKATLDKIPAGEYNLSSTLKSVGSARQKITVKAGETLSVELKLAPRAPK